MDFKKLKNLFVESAGEVSKPASVTDKTDVSPVIKKQDNKPQAVADDKSLDENVLDVLLKSIEKNNLPGEDYIEFMEALKAMKNLNLDDKIKFQTVMATLSTKGLTKNKIIESADFYIKILESEFEKFTATLAAETKNQVEKREEDIKNIEKANTSKALEIQKLTKEINKNVEQIGIIKRQIEESKVKINKGQKRFVDTYDYLRNQILSNIEKIKTL